MGILEKRSFDDFWNAYTRFIDKFAVWVVVCFVLLAGGAVWYAVNNLGINSKTSEMFDESLPFRARQNKFNDAFPATGHNLVIVIKAQNPEKTDSLTHAMVQHLRSYPGLFNSIYVPGGGDFFKKNQLLFPSEKRLEKLSANLKQSQILFSLLAQNYSLRGLFAFLNQVVSMGNTNQISHLDKMFGEMAHTIRSRLSGQKFIMSWQRVLTDRSLAKNRDVRFIQLRPQFDYGRLLSVEPAMANLRQHINDMQAGPDASIRITGNVAMSYHELRSVMKGAIIAGILAFILVGLVLWIGLRSIKLISGAILTLLVGLALTTGFSALVVGELNIISAAFAVLYIGLSIDYSIHFALRFNELRQSGNALFEAFKKSFGSLFSALLLSTISTALGFYAFVPTSFGGVSELGLIAGTGMIISFIATFTFLPAVLRLLYHNGNQTAHVPLSAPMAEPISLLQVKHAMLIRRLSIAIAIISAISLFKITFNYNPINLRDPHSESVATMDELIRSKTFSPWTIEIMADDSLSAMKQALQLRRKKSVGRVTTLFSFIPKNQPQKLSVIHSLKARYKSIPPVKKDSASYKLKNQIGAIKNLRKQITRYHKAKDTKLIKLQTTLGNLLKRLSKLPALQQKLLIKNIEYGLLKTFPATLQDLQQSFKASRVTYANIPATLKQRWKSTQNQYRIKISPAPAFDKNNESRRTFASSILHFNDKATGNLITIIKSGDTVKNAFKNAMGFAFLVITILLILYLKSFRDTLYVLLPIILAGFMTCAAMVFFGLHFNFANVIALPLLFGLGVDNGVHIVYQAKSDTVDIKDMLRTSTARAIFFSALTTLFSFGNLVFSPHRGTASMGLILSFGLVFIIFATLVVLPAFLMKSQSGWSSDGDSSAKVKPAKEEIERISKF